MKRRGWVLLLSGLLFLTALAACSDAALISADPNLSGVQAQATLQFIQALQTSTALRARVRACTNYGCHRLPNYGCHRSRRLELVAIHVQQRDLARAIRYVHANTLSCILLYGPPPDWFLDYARSAIAQL